MIKETRPLFGQISRFFIWLNWLFELGGSYQYLGDPPTDPKQPPKRTGRRDPDKKPRTYPLDPDKYGMDPKTGSIWRRA